MIKDIAGLILLGATMISTIVLGLLFLIKV